MENIGNHVENWQCCDVCLGRGKIRLRLTKKTRKGYQLACEAYEKSNGLGEPPARPKGVMILCENCAGTGLLPAENRPIADTEKYPHLAIIGGGIGGTALALACLHRNIPFTLFERDAKFDDRSQGYGLTLQQASKAMKELGIPTLKENITSTKHVIHQTNGEIIGEWGRRKWEKTDVRYNPAQKNKRANKHISRQTLRQELLTHLGGDHQVQWGHKLIDYQTSNDGVDLYFEVDGISKQFHTDLLVGADGIRSNVRKKLIPDAISPLRYLDCIVILGICQFSDLADSAHPLLDNATVFQTANGVERMYMMPYAKDVIMWQFSFPMSEKDAIALSAKGPDALKEEAQRRTQWHHPIPAILAATPTSFISGYPVYDRTLLEAENFQNAGPVTLIGDAAHPMSPFKGQGANQALLDALALARAIKTRFNHSDDNKATTLREVLTEFEDEMIVRSSVKVKDSANAAKFLHSNIVLQVGNETIGAKWIASQQNNEEA